MTDQRILGVVREYDDLVALCLQRMTDLEITYSILDALTGLQDGYCAKVIGPDPPKCLGPVSFGPIMAGLRIKLVAIEDSDALVNMRQRLGKRRVRARQRTIARSDWLWRPHEAALMAQLRWEGVPMWKRKRLARKAGRASARARRLRAPAARPR